MKLTPNAKTLLGQVDRAGEHGAVIAHSSHRDELQAAGLIYIRPPEQVGGDGMTVSGGRPRWFLSVIGHDAVVALADMVDLEDAVLVERVKHTIGGRPFWRATAGRGGPVVSNDHDLNALVGRLHDLYPREALVIMPGTVTI